MRRLLLFLLACSTSPAPAPGVQARMDFASRELFAAPFPSDHLLEAGRVRVDGFPNPDGNDLARRVVELVARDAHGFALAGAIFFPLTGPVDRARLPDLAGSTRDDASVFVMSVADGKKHPVEVRFTEEGGFFSAPNMLSMLPLQGIPLRPRTTYAAVVRTSVMARAPALDRIAAGERLDGMNDASIAEYRDALAKAGPDVAALTVFTTDDPTAVFLDAARDVPASTITGLARTDTYDGYCVYAGRMKLPVYQQGQPPYDKTGGDFALDARGRLLLQREEEANVVVTVPRATMPQGGFPAVVFIRTGAGGERPLVDRGPRTSPTEAPVPGSGPAVDIARAGYIGISVDGPHGGLRNVSKGDEQFLMFNIFNGGALRDNVRQSALELVVQRRALDSLEIDTSDCAGAPARAKIDAGHVALLGHSMGATIAPLVLAAEPRYGAAILSGAGASWVENVMHKKKPLEVRPALELLIGYARERKLLTAHDPMVTMLQWAAEPADPQVYAHLVAPRHVLMFQGIVDRYILPRIANALALPLGLDLAGPVLDKGHPELAEQTSIEAVLPLVGRKVIPLPAQGNQAGATAVVVQHPEDGIDDGHEVMYQLAAPKEQYRCFLATFARGTPLVTQPGVTCD